MKKLNFKAILPHLIAVGVFLLISVIFCKPALDNDLVLKQQDISGWKGMSQQLFEYKEAHGHSPLWLTNMFSGMPAYQVNLEGDFSPLLLLDGLFQLWLPQPMNFFFLACICFYFMCICFGIRTFAAILGSIGFAYCSFSPIIITAGHNTQMLALAYAPAVIGAVIMIFKRKYFAGFVLAVVFTALQIAQGHQQISYYLFLILLAISINYAVLLIKKKETTHLLKSFGAMAVAGIIGVAVNAMILWTVYDFSKESKRGGQLVMETAGKNDNVAGNKTIGLTKEYAFQWSYGKQESFSLMFPGVMGYGTHYAERDGESYMFPKLDESSHVVTYMTEKLNVPPDAFEQVSSYMSQKLYWGDQPFTNGPVYLGAVFCFLFIIGMFMLDSRHKWWILITCIIAIMLAWGKNFAAFNYFIFDNIPFYNKFRAPTMTLVIPQILVPLLSALALNRIIDNSDPEAWKKYRRGLIATAAMFIIASVVYVNSDFSQENRERTRKFDAIYNSSDPAKDSKFSELNITEEPLKDNRLYEEMVMNFKGSPDAQKSAKDIVREVRKDRASLFGGDIMRSFIFVLIAAVFLALYIRKTIPLTLMLGGVILTSAIDLLSFGMKYLNDKSYESKDKFESVEFPYSAADEQIKKDPDPNFRVFNTTGGDPFQESKTSYYHKSIGGYHPAKIGIYDDLIAYQLSGSPNISVLNMLNTKYVIQRQGDAVQASVNPGALGNCWFVKGVRYVNGPAEEMKALSAFEPGDTAIADVKYKNLIGSFSPADSSSSIKMTTFDNDAITYQSRSSAKHFAVFSEVYYKDWNAYIDGKPVEIVKVNYVLRGLPVPAGNHKIEFKFEPAVFYTGKTISNVASWLAIALIVALIFVELKKRRAS